MNKIELAVQETIQSIDVSETAYEQAEERYQAIGAWLQRKDSELIIFSPDVYTQGSFALGTVIRPLDDSADYDIDLVCHLKTEKSQCTQEEIKTILGEELKKYALAKNMSDAPEEGRRCWTMIYSSSDNSAGFHLDALPSISSLSYTEAKKKYGSSSDPQYLQINITDNEKDNYGKISEGWNVSNPKGYVEWFNSRQQNAISIEKGNYVKKMLFSRITASTEDVPSYAVKTPLQKAIQFLKRHRDIYFQNNSDIKPISIIITTLVAQTYRESHSSIVDVIGHFIKDYKECIINNCIENPVNPEENFADKWAEYHEREDAFYGWMQKLEMDFSNLDSLPAYEKPIEYVRNLLLKLTNNTTYQRDVASSSVIDYNVPHKQDFNFKIVGDSSSEITASYLKKGFRPQVLRSDDLIKKCNHITFKINDKHIRGKKKYYWQVVNNGPEAMEVNNGRRGGFYDGDTKRGGRTRRESTVYKGTHWVQCFIVQNGICVSKSPEFIVKIIDS